MQFRVMLLFVRCHWNGAGRSIVVNQGQAVAGEIAPSIPKTSTRRAQTLDGHAKQKT